MRTSLRALLFLLASLLPFVATSAVPQAGTQRPNSAALRATHVELRERLASSPFGKPLHLTASDDRHRVSGDAYAVLDHSFAQAREVLATPSEWCEILLLPFNTKQCEASGGAANAISLTVHVGRKHTTPVESTHRLDFRFESAARSDDYLRVQLTAPSGPFGTRDYRIVLELVPIDERHTFMHFGYAYGYGALARVAMQGYLSTIGANKVGFTREGKTEDGQPALVTGIRGVMERNTMRYYLAIESYLRTHRLPQPQRTTRLVEDWFAAVERYPRQLHEMERDDYVEMKVHEYERMHAAVSRAPRTASSSP